MKNAGKLILVFMVFVLVWMVVHGMMISRRMAQRAEPKAAIAVTNVAVTAEQNENWPMFHGAADLRGFTTSLFPNSL